MFRRACAPCTKNITTNQIRYFQASKMLLDKSTDVVGTMSAANGGFIHYIGTPVIVMFSAYLVTDTFTNRNH